MLLSDRHKFIFLHNPKCGGSSIKEAMKDYCENYPFIPEGQTSQHYHHWPARQAKSYFKQIGMDWKWSGLCLKYNFCPWGPPQRPFFQNNNFPLFFGHCHFSTK